MNIDDKGFLRGKKLTFNQFRTVSTHLKHTISTFKDYFIEHYIIFNIDIFLICTFPFISVTVECIFNQ